MAIRLAFLCLVRSGFNFKLSSFNFRTLSETEPWNREFVHHALAYIERWKRLLYKDLTVHGEGRAQSVLERQRETGSSTWNSAKGHRWAGRSPVHRRHLTRISFSYSNLRAFDKANSIFKQLVKNCQDLFSCWTGVYMWEYMCVIPAWCVCVGVCVHVCTARRELSLHEPDDPFLWESTCAGFRGVTNSLFASSTLVSKEPREESRPFVGEVMGILPEKGGQSREKAILTEG